mgnify:CR=1 FL=1
MVFQIATEHDTINYKGVYIMPNKKGKPKNPYGGKKKKKTKKKPYAY